MVGRFMNSSVLMFLLSFYLLGCGQYTSEEVNFNAVEVDELTSVVLKDNYIVCFLGDDTRLTCNNKNDTFPIFIILSDLDEGRILKVDPKGQDTILVNGLLHIERKKIEIWDECRVTNPPDYCEDILID